MHCKKCILCIKTPAYPPLKDLFFLRPFYVLSTSFLRNGYMEVARLHTMHILPVFYPYITRIPLCKITTKFAGMQKK